MGENPLIMAERLTEYVDELLDAKIQTKRGAIKGRTQMILTVLGKLRKAHQVSPLSSDLIQRIQDDKKRAALNLPETSANYQNICWECHKIRGIQVIVDKRVDSVCKACGWVQCPNCGACRDPKYGGCSERVYLTPKNQIPEEPIPF